VRRSLAAAVALTVLAAGCGGGGGAAQRSTTTARVAATTAGATHSSSRAARDYRRLYADVRAMHGAAATVKRSSLLGTPALRRTTASFLDYLETSALTLKGKNRMIDHAAAAVAPVCEQCFQMLEAARPIPQIAGH
jgi:hypothetical protein